MAFYLFYVTIEKMQLEKTDQGNSEGRGGVEKQFFFKLQIKGSANI